MSCCTLSLILTLTLVEKTYCEILTGNDKCRWCRCWVTDTNHSGFIQLPNGHRADVSNITYQPHQEVIRNLRLAPTFCPKACSSTYLNAKTILTYQHGREVSPPLLASMEHPFTCSAMNTPNTASFHWTQCLLLLLLLLCVHTWHTPGAHKVLPWHSSACCKVSSDGNCTAATYSLFRNGVAASCTSTQHQPKL